MEHKLIHFFAELMYFYFKLAAMDYTFDISLKTRTIFFTILEDLSLEQLTTIPSGFSNTIFWNIKHVVITQQLLIYGLSDLPMAVSEAEIKEYRKGSKPISTITNEDILLLKKQLLSTLEQTKKDYTNQLFKTYSEYTVSTKSSLRNVEEALEFNNVHEGIHLGYILAMKKAI